MSLIKVMIPVRAADSIEDALKKHIGKKVCVVMKKGHNWIGKITEVDRGVLTLNTGVRVVIYDIKDVLNMSLDAGEKQKAQAAAGDARTDWNMELFKLTEMVKKLVKKAEAEGADSFGKVFKDCLKVLRGY